MACEYCNQVGNHSPRCPLFSYTPSKHCTMCKEPIYPGEEYIKNSDDEYMHYDCASTYDLIKFFGEKIYTES